MSSSWKHPAIPYDVLIDPLSMPNPDVLNMELKSTEEDETILITVGKLSQSSTQFDKALGK